MGVVSAAVRTHREFIVRLVKPKRFSVGLDGFVEDNIFVYVFNGVSPVRGVPFPHFKVEVRVASSAVGRTALIL
jgi:hypothetical protein